MNQILIKKNLISHREAFILISIYERHKKLKIPTNFNGNKVIYCQELVEEPNIKVLWDIKNKCFLETKKFFSLKEAYLDSIILAQLDEGNCHPEHADNETFKNGQWIPNHTPYRNYSGLLYLNSDFEGGELIFNEYNLLIKPQIGLYISFPSSRYFVHAVRPVTCGKRYSLALWFTKYKQYACKTNC